MSPERGRRGGEELRGGSDGSREVVHPPGASGGPRGGAALHSRSRRLPRYIAPGHLLRRDGEPRRGGMRLLHGECRGGYSVPQARVARSVRLLLLLREGPERRRPFHPVGHPRAPRRRRRVRSAPRLRPRHQAGVLRRGHGLREGFERVQQGRTTRAGVATQDRLRGSRVTRSRKPNRRVADGLRPERSPRPRRVVTQVHGVERVEPVELRQEREPQPRPPVPLYVGLVLRVSSAPSLRFLQTVDQHEPLLLVRARHRSRALRRGPRTVRHLSQRVVERLLTGRGRQPPRLVNLIGVEPVQSRELGRHAPLLRVQVGA